MSNSPRYLSLRERIDELRNHFLPADIDETQDYGLPAQVDDTIAFRLLAHAEIEHFIEDICEDAANRAVEEWIRQKRIGLPTLALVCFCESSGKAPDALSLEGKPAMLERLEEAKNSFTQFLHQRNNGIRQGNLARMLFRVGLAEVDIPAGFGDLMDQLGKNRGEVAHKSVGKVHERPHPHSELKLVEGIMEALKTVDDKLASMAFR